VLTVPGGVDVEIETPLEHLTRPLGQSGRPSEATVRARAPELAAQIERRVQARTALGRCDVEREAPRVVQRDVQSLTLLLRFYCPEGSVRLENAWPLELEPGAHSLCAVDGAAWIVRRDSLTYEVGAPKTVQATLREFLELGARHVLSGIDHVLFLLALLVHAAWDRRSEPLGRRFGGVALLVTSFTLGHSLTLLAAGLGWLILSTRVVESVIALSVVLVGVSNAMQPRARGRPLVAAGFGLVHGLGFAASLGDTELPRRAAVLALLAFNVGIELAQLALVLAVFPVLTYAARRPGYRPWFAVPVSCLIAAFGALWFVKRASGTDFLPGLGG
jgi:hydrogenase/urease accessory protein HupE